MGIRIKALNQNYIPELVSERLKNWAQPLATDIVVDDEFALMTLDTFNQLQALPEKFHYLRDPGKMAKYEYIDGWNLYWYGLHKNTDMVSLHFRKILLV